MWELLKDLPGVIYAYEIRKDNSRAFTYVSEASKTILGIDADALLADSSLLRQCILPDDLPDFEKSLQLSHESNAPWNWEGRIMINNAVRWIETRSAALHQNDVIVRKGIIIDITERKKQEQEHEVRYQSLIESLPLGIGIHLNGRLVLANAFAHKLLKAEPNALIGRNVLDFVHPESRELVEERMKRVSAGEFLPMAQERLVCVDGEVIEVETLAVPYTFRKKPAIQLIVRDITEHKRTQEAIRKNETFFTQLFENVPMAVVMLDEVGQVELVNKGFTEMFGYSLGELKGKKLNDFIVPEKYLNEGIDIDNLVTSDKVICVEAIRKNKAGELVNVILYGVPVRLEGWVIGIYGVYVDITEHKRMEEELQVRNDELDNFVYKVSHDLRAPLSSILGLVHLAGLPGNTDDVSDYIKIIGKKVEGLDHFISDVLSHSKNLKREVETEQVDFRKIIDQTISDLSYLQGAAEVEFSVQADVGEFHSDPWRISEIFRNLVSNAIKYRQVHGSKSRVTVNIKLADEGARIIFTDNGIGIEKQKLDRVFEMFYRATEQSDGSGIGLYIVKNAVEKLGGRIRVDSAVGQGATFTIELPNQKSKPPAKD
jgi:PAS domain S-box-containing protein